MSLTIYHYKRCIRPLDVRKTNARKKWWWSRKIPCSVKIMHLFIITHRLMLLLKRLRFSISLRQLHRKQHQEVVAMKLCAAWTRKYIDAQAISLIGCYINHFIALISSMRSENLFLSELFILRLIVFKLCWPHANLAIQQYYSVHCPRPFGVTTFYVHTKCSLQLPKESIDTVFNLHLYRLFGFGKFFRLRSIMIEIGIL